MTTFLSENLNETESVNTGPTRLQGWSLTNTGTEQRFVSFLDGDTKKQVIVVPPGKERNMNGLFEPYASGLSVESLVGDGTLIANVFYEDRVEIVSHVDEEHE